MKYLSLLSAVALALPAAEEPTAGDSELTKSIEALFREASQSVDSKVGRPTSPRTSLSDPFDVSGAEDPTPSIRHSKLIDPFQDEPLKPPALSAPDPNLEFSAAPAAKVSSVPAQSQGDLADPFAELEKTNLHLGSFKALAGASDGHLGELMREPVAKENEFKALSDLSPSDVSEKPSLEDQVPAFPHVPSMQPLKTPEVELQKVNLEKSKETQVAQGVEGAFQESMKIIEVPVLSKQNKGFRAQSAKQLQTDLAAEKQLKQLDSEVIGSQSAGVSFDQKVNETMAKKAEVTRSTENFTMVSNLTRRSNLTEGSNLTGGSNLTIISNLTRMAKESSHFQSNLSNWSPPSSFEKPPTEPPALEARKVLRGSEARPVVKMKEDVERKDPRPPLPMKTFASFWTTPLWPAAPAASADTAPSSVALVQRGGGMDFTKVMEEPEEPEISISEPFRAWEDEDRREAKRLKGLDRRLRLRAHEKEVPGSAEELVDARQVGTWGPWAKLEEEDRKIEATLLDLDDPRRPVNLREYQELNALQDESMAELDGQIRKP